jgi:HAE1 family hydrophobic/amphiphilic exporter-1
VTSFVGVGGPTATQNSGPLFAVLKSRSERPQMKRRCSSRCASAFARSRALQVYMQPVQNLRLGGRQSKARFQYTLQSVNAGEMVPWATRLMERMRADTDFRDVTSDSQNRGLQATLEIDRDKAGVLGVAVGDLRLALYNAYGDRQIGSIYAGQQHLPGDSGSRGGQRPQQFEDDVSRLSVRGNTGRLVPLSAFSTVQPHGGPDRGQPPGPVAGGHGASTSGPTCRWANATKRRSTASRRRDEDAALASSPAMAATRRCSRVRRAARPCCSFLAVLVIYVLLGVLYESYIHPITILAGLPSAAVGALLSLKLFRHGPDLIATIGILLLIGIVKKNAIMMIDFALDAQRTRA